MDEIAKLKVRLDTLERWAMDEKKYLLARLIEAEARETRMSSKVQSSQPLLVDDATCTT